MQHPRSPCLTCHWHLARHSKMNKTCYHCRPRLDYAGAMDGPPRCRTDSVSGCAYRLPRSFARQLGHLVPLSEADLM